MENSVRLDLGLKERGVTAMVIPKTKGMCAPLVRFFACALLCFGAGGLPLPSSAQTMEQRAMMAAVAQERSSNLLLDDEDSTPVEVLPIMRVERLEAPLPGIEKWHIRMPTTGASPYTLVSDGNELLRLGGFPAPDLYRVAEILRRRSGGRRERQLLVRDLIGMADPNGGLEVVFPFKPAWSTESVSVGRSWLACKRPEWLPDRDIQGDSTSSEVRITVLTRDPRGRESWLPAQYAFSFGPDGVLLGWSRRFGERFVPERGCTGWAGP
jgi:hypothetical protein